MLPKVFPYDFSWLTIGISRSIHFLNKCNLVQSLFKSRSFFFHDIILYQWWIHKEKIIIMNKYICCRSKKLFFSLNIFFPIYFKIQFPNRRTIMNIFLIFKTPPKKFQGSLTNCNKRSTAKTGVANKWLLFCSKCFLLSPPKRW